MQTRFCASLIALTMLFTAAARGDDAAPADLVVHLTASNKTKVMVFIPHEAKPARGAILHAANMGLKPSRRWSELCRSLKFVHVVTSVDMKSNRRPTKVREATIEALNRLAKELDRPELAHLPLAPTGHSAGGMGLPALDSVPDRLLTAAIDCSWVYKYENKDHMKQIPLLFVIGSIPDGFKMIPAIEGQYDPARKDGAMATLGFEWGKAHAFGNAGTLFAAWFSDVAKQRIDYDADPGSEPVKLRDMKLEDGWLGDRSSWETSNAVIAPYSEYKGDKDAAVWLPSKAFAYTWRAYQSKDAPVSLTASSADGEHTLKAFKPSTEFQLEVPAGTKLTLGVKASDTVELAKVRYYRNDELLGEAAAAPWSFEVGVLPVGTHPIHAICETAAGQQTVTNPALFVVYPNHEQKSLKLDTDEAK